ncbi:hypothetical protein [Micromonospora sp. C72]|uniref:hypothetical protein n=1 Tax=Micromonospora sp. C72 TaxID=2824880 RepID=UPI0027DD2AA9|nr:hypothetical protein [Micromonospora sp. C72]
MVAAVVCAVVAGCRSYAAIGEWVADLPADTAQFAGYRPAAASVGGNAPPAATGAESGPIDRGDRRVARRSARSSRATCCTSSLGTSRMAR